MGRRPHVISQRPEAVILESPEEPLISEIVEEVAEAVLPEVVEQPEVPVEQPEVAPTVEEPAPVESVPEEVVPPVEEPQPEKNTETPETPAPRIMKQTKRVVKKVQHRKPVEFSLGAFASVSIGAPISIGVTTTPARVPPTPAEAPAAPEPVKPKEGME